LGQAALCGFFFAKFLRSGASIFFACCVFSFTTVGREYGFFFRSFDSMISCASKHRTRTPDNPLHCGAMRERLRVMLTGCYVQGKKRGNTYAALRETMSANFFFSSAIQISICFRMPLSLNHFRASSSRSIFARICATSSESTAIKLYADVERAATHCPQR